MQDEYIRQRFEEWKSESGYYAWLGSTGDEEFHLRDLFRQSPNDREDGGLWFVIRALVQCVDNNDRWNIRRFEWFDNHLLHLTVERLVYDVRIRLEEQDENRSNLRVFVCQLESNGREDEAEVAAILEIARTEERRSEKPVGEERFADRLGDRGLSSPGEPVQPEDGRLVEVFGP